MRIVWKHLPLAIHNDAPAAHLASVAAQKQGKFWEFHDKLFANQRQIKMDNLKQYAQELGLDMPRFEKDMLDLKNKTSIDADMAEASAMGLTGTPGFFINGRFLSGAKPYGEFKTLVDKALGKG